MFVALRDLKFARGRFALIVAVVALITVLVGFLSGLTGGLATQNISAVLSLPADRIVLAAPSRDEAPSFAESAITEKQATAWKATKGVTSVDPLGVTQARVEAGDSSVAVALFGVQSGFNANAPSHDGQIGLSDAAAKSLNVHKGDRVTVAGASYTVARIGGDDWYSHTPVVEVTLRDWQKYSAATGSPDAYATALAVKGDANWTAADKANDTLSQSPIMSLTALNGFKEEIGSLLMIIVMLFGISGLVIGAFFAVWTVQRKGDIAILKAVGASTRSLVKDALGQAFVVLVLGIGIGLGVVAVLGAFAGAALPFLLSPLTTVVPGVIMIVLGLAGAAFALRSVTAADPLTALGSNR